MSAASSTGEIWLKALLAIFFPPTRRKPCTTYEAGGSIPAAMHMAGHHTQWKRMMSLPIKWHTNGHHFSNRSASVP